jgi:hypothetical protein
LIVDIMLSVWLRYQFARLLTVFCFIHNLLFMVSKTKFLIIKIPVCPPHFSGVRVTRSLVLCVCLLDRCFPLFFWPLCYLSFVDLRILITPLVSSNTSPILCSHNFTKNVVNKTWQFHHVSFKSESISNIESKYRT